MFAYDYWLSVIIGLLVTGLFTLGTLIYNFF